METGKKWKKKALDRNIWFGGQDSTGSGVPGRVQARPPVAADSSDLKL